MKVLLVATVQSHICQFHKPLVKMLHSHGAEVHVAARDNLAEKNGLELDFAQKVFDLPFSRSPKSKDNIKAYKQLKEIIKEENYDVVHCNTPMGGIVGRLAAKKARKKGTKVFYTAHGFHFYKGAPKKNWMVYYPIEKHFAKHKTDKLILVAEADYELAKRKKFGKDIEHIHSVGVNSVKYHPFTDEQKLQFRAKHGFEEDDFICLCTGELNKNKNQQALIKCAPEILKTIPNFKLVLAGNGPQEQVLKALIKELNVEESIKLVGYRTDLEEFVCLSDIIASVSKREGLPVNILEAMASGKPIIVSNNRGHNELIKSGENGFILSWDNVEKGFLNSITLLNEDKDLYNSFIENGLAFVQKYLDTNVENELEKIYFG